MGQESLGNIHLRDMSKPEGFHPGDTIMGHTHTWSHVSFFEGGRWNYKIWIPAFKSDGSEYLDENNKQIYLKVKDQDRDGPFHLLIEPHYKHQFTFIGRFIPQRMLDFAATLSPEKGQEFKDLYKELILSQPSKAFCIYSHRTPQGDVTEMDMAIQSDHV